MPCSCTALPAAGVLVCLKVANAAARGAAKDLAGPLGHGSALHVCCACVLCCDGASIF